MRDGTSGGNELRKCAGGATVQVIFDRAVRLTECPQIYSKYLHSENSTFSS